ncbi:Polysaccharide biosynthesis protein [Corynebacterium atrinae]|uniref:lipopolysaccharide biosynthesis protein n=1 Tax=Corynebacterium atrinae TaxID=1336740 RepID=UPI0025B39CFA|nr:hypothetical protein [Corynebacterium atrinae]WJY64422.1 Polysaccharide biosynthesis protein [Corynebacterium atrinae]
MSSRAKSGLFPVAGAAAGTLLYNLGQWLILILLTQYAGIIEVGLFSLALAISAPFSLLTGMALRTVYVTDVDPERSFGDFLVLRLAGSTLTIVVCLFYALATGTIGTIFVAVVFCKSIDSVTDIFCAPLQENGRLLRIGFQSGLNGVVSAASVAFFLVFLDASVDVAILSSLLGSIAALLVSLPAPRVDTFRASFPAILQIAQTAWPLGISAMVVSLMANVPRYVLNGYVDVGAVGIFSAVAYLTVIGTAVVAALAQLLLPRLVATNRTCRYPALRSDITKLVALTSLASSFIVVAGFFIASPLLSWLYGNEYNEPFTFTILLAAWAAGAVSWMIDLGLSTRRQFRMQLISSLVALTAVTIASFILIAKFNLEGAGLAALIGSVIHLLMRAIFFYNPPPTARHRRPPGQPAQQHQPDRT